MIPDPIPVPTAAGPSAVVAALVALLGEAQAEQGRHAVERIAARLDRIEYEARWEGAPEDTLSAIRAARLLLACPALPLPPRRETSRRPPAAH